MLMATHDLRLAANIARNVVFLDGGQVVESGSASEVFSRPRQARTIAFVSSLSQALPEWNI